MKTLSAFCLLLSIATGLHAQVDLDFGLVAHWELDSNALDSGPNLHHGTVAGPLATNDRFGNPYSAYQFNGIPDCVNLPPVFGTLPTAVTFSCWFKAPTSNPEGKLIHHGQSGEFSLWTNTDTVVVAVHLGDFLPEGWIWVAQKFVDDNWHFIAGRWEYGQMLEMYYDGQVVASTPAPAVHMMDPGPQFTASLGKYRYSNVAYYRGFLDDVRIYERALSDEELGVLFGGFTTSVPQTSAASGLELFQNQPSPATGSTTISFTQPSAGAVSLRVFDLNGRLVKELENATLSSGTHSYTMDLSMVDAGVYLYELRSSGSVLSRKLLVE